MSRAADGSSGGVRLIMVLSVLVAALVLLPTRAHAHLKLQRSIPVSDARLTTAPEALRLVFSQPIELAFSRVSLVGPAGEVALAPAELATDDKRVLVASIRGGLTAGTYTVRWQTAGPDGHPIRGEYSFRIEESATGLTAPESVTTPTAPGTPAQAPLPAERPVDAAAAGEAFSAGSPLYAAVRWLTFLGLLGVIGVVAFRGPVLARVRRHEGMVAEGFVECAARRAAGLGLGAVMLLVIALVLRLYAQSVALNGVEDAFGGARVGVMLTRTTWGWGWLLQAAGTVVALFGFLAARRDARLGWGLALLGTIALAFTPALSGHAAAVQELTALTILADGLHVLGAGGWLGSLLAVVLIGLPVALRLQPERRGTTVAHLIHAFSPTAIIFAGTVVATGLFAAWLHLGSVPALWESAYGRTLLLKLALLLGVFGTGAYNWLKVKPSLGTETAATHLRRSATLELAVGVLVLAVTAVLVATPPPAEMEMTAAVQSADPSAGVRPPHGP